MNGLITSIATATFHATIIIVISLGKVANVDAQSSSIPFYNDADPSFLFIGNSYTSYNTLHEMFASVMRDGVPEWSETLHTNSVNPGGKKLYQHLTDLEGGGTLQPLLAPAASNADAWKWVVLQDQSQLPGFYQWDDEGDEYYNSFTAAQALNEYVEETGAQTIFYMTWGRRVGDASNPGFYPDFLTMQGHLTEGYMRYRSGTSTPERPTFVAPVGLAFQTIHNDLVDQGIMPTDAGTLFTQLYTGDDSHPAPPGTYVAALTLFTSMTGIDPTTINFWPDSIEEETARTLQDAVSRTVLETFENGFIPYAWTTSWTGSTVGAAGNTPAEAAVTREPTKSPTRRPTATPAEAAVTRGPTESPTRRPTAAPTRVPTRRPTDGPTRMPTPEPTIRPTPEPTLNPTPVPTTSMPTVPDATLNPTAAPVITNTPTIADTTSNPTVATSVPTISETTSNPTVFLTTTGMPTVDGATSNPTVASSTVDSPLLVGATSYPTVILGGAEVISPSESPAPSFGSATATNFTQTASPVFIFPGNGTTNTTPTSTPVATVAPTVAKLEPLPTPQAIVVSPSTTPSGVAGTFVGAGMDESASSSQYSRIYLRCILLVTFSLATFFLL